MKGRDIKRIREQKEITQEQLAQLLGVNKSSITKWEADPNKEIFDKYHRPLKMIKGMSVTALGALIGTAALTGGAMLGPAAVVGILSGMFQLKSDKKQQKQINRLIEDMLNDPNADTVISLGKFLKSVEKSKVQKQ